MRGPRDWPEDEPLRYHFPKQTPSFGDVRTRDGLPISKVARKSCPHGSGVNLAPLRRGRHGLEFFSESVPLPFSVTYCTDDGVERAGLRDCLAVARKFGL